MRKEKEGARTVDRRGFLKHAGLAIGSAGVAASVGGSEAAAATDDVQVQGSGYRETEHVRTYYKLARF